MFTDEILINFWTVAVILMCMTTTYKITEPRMLGSLLD